LPRPAAISARHRFDWRARHAGAREPFGAMWFLPAQPTPWGVAAGFGRRRGHRARRLDDVLKKEDKKCSRYSARK
jgi:hypothetical protein